MENKPTFEPQDTPIDPPIPARKELVLQPLSADLSSLKPIAQNPDTDPNTEQSTTYTSPQAPPSSEKPPAFSPADIYPTATHGNPAGTAQPINSPISTVPPNTKFAKGPVLKAPKMPKKRNWATIITTAVIIFVLIIAGLLWWFSRQTISYTEIQANAKDFSYSVQFDTKAEAINGNEKSTVVGRDLKGEAVLTLVVSKTDKVDEVCTKDTSLSEQAEYSKLSNNSICYLKPRKAYITFYRHNGSLYYGIIFASTSKNDIDKKTAETVLNSIQFK